MGFLDNAKKKLTDAVDKHGDKIADGVDKAGAAVDSKTKGKYSDKIAKGQAKAKDALDGLDGRNDDIKDEPTPGTATDTGPISGPQTHDPRE